MKKAMIIIIAFMLVLIIVCSSIGLSAGSYQEAVSGVYSLGYSIQTVVEYVKNTIMKIKNYSNDIIKYDSEVDINELPYCFSVIIRKYNLPIDQESLQYYFYIYYNILYCAAYSENNMSTTCYDILEEVAPEFNQISIKNSIGKIIDKLITNNYRKRYKAILKSLSDENLYNKLFLSEYYIIKKEINGNIKINQEISLYELLSHNIII